MNKNIIDSIDNLKVGELVQLVKDLEEKWGVSATAVASSSAVAVEEVEEQSEFEIIIESAGDKKINVIKAVRAITGLGLKEAKEKAEEPGASLGKFNKEDAKKHESALKEAGAKIVLK